MIYVAAAALGLALLPCLVYLRNLREYLPPPSPAGPLPPVSVLIPARNEARSIGPAVASVLASSGVELEVIVLDDHSEDDTRVIVQKIAVGEGRVRVETAPPLPPGWCGKQHACHTLGGLARFDVLAFMDADVRLAPDGLARAVAFLQSSGADLVSGIPRQETGSLVEKLVIPVIHFLLLGFLPVWRMRLSREPAYGAGCGQLFVARRGGYEAVGGHAAVRSSLHDGLTLPRAYRRAGRVTDLFDATDAAVCRMYRSGPEVWHGLAKNAREGLASARLIGPATIILLGGQVAPFVLVALLWPWTDTLATGLALAAVLAAWAPRLDAAVRFRQSPLGAVLHPLGILIVLAIQWYAACRAALGRPAGWKGRAYPVVPDAGKPDQTHISR